MNKRGKKERSIEDYDDEEIASRKNFVEDAKAVFYADLLKGWRNVTHIPSGKEGGKIEILEYTHEAAVVLLKKAVWLHGGIDDFLGNEANWRQNVTGG